ncbi:hypothetical protein CVT24_008638, partial [Panaeolus cyanescens]
AVAKPKFRQKNPSSQQPLSPSLPETTSSDDTSSSISQQLAKLSNITITSPFRRSPTRPIFSSSSSDNQPSPIPSDIDTISDDYQPQAHQPSIAQPSQANNIPPDHNDLLNNLGYSYFLFSLNTIRTQPYKCQTYLTLILRDYI